MKAMTIFKAYKCAEHEYYFRTNESYGRRRKRQFDKFFARLMMCLKRLDFIDEQAKIKTGLDEEREED